MIGLRKHLSLFFLAAFRPARAWPAILSDPKDAGWLYLWVAIESLLMRPAQGTRAVWAVMRRGPPHAMAVASLAGIQIAVVLLGSYVLAFVVRLALQQSRAKLEMGTYSAILPWLYAPKLVLSAVVAGLWGLQLVPDDTMMFTALFELKPWTIGYYALSIGLVVWSFVAFFRTHGDRFDWSSDVSAIEMPWWRRVVPIAILLAGASAVSLRAAYAPSTFRPIGQGDRVPTLSFAGLRDEPAVTLSFPRERPVVIDFWATWCRPCVAALPGWHAQWLKRDELGADFVSANVENDVLDHVQHFAEEHQVGFPVHVADATTQGIFQVTTLPTVLIVSREGDIVEYWVGAHDEDAIAEALARAK